MAACAVEQAAQLPHFLQGMRDELLSAETRVDAHQKHQVHVGCDVFKDADGRGRIERDACLHARLVYLPDDTMQVRTSLVVHVHEISAEGLDLINKLLGLHNHEVHVERLLANARHMLQHGKAEGYVGHEDAVHDVDVEPVGTALVEPLHLGLEIGEIGSKQRRR